LGDIEDVGLAIHQSNLEKKVSFDNKTIEFLKDLCAMIHTQSTQKDIEAAMQSLRRRHHASPNKTQLSAAYGFCIENKMIDANETVRCYIKAKEMRGLSGVIVISVITSPYPGPYPEYVDENGKTKMQRFSCKHDCHYCPREVDQNGREVNARSYLSDEPTVARGLRYKYDAIGQYNDRAQQYHRNGHYVDKIEIIVLGGTWTEYPRQYQETYIRDIFYAANTFYEKGDRGKKTLFEEKHINETSKSRIIGLTLEMRPDSITYEEIAWLRKLGCTRVQLGVQHIDDDILKKVNRGCYRVDTERALKMLKDSGYKVDAHWMPDLPGSSPTVDQKMFNEILSSEWLQFDQWKIYPTAVVPWTRIKKWYDEGSYVPYTDKNPEDLIRVLMDVKSKVPEWIRLNRVVRDIPNTTLAGDTYIYGGNKVTNLRQILENRMHREGTFCRCIRCREVRKNTKMFDHATIVSRDYRASGGHEYFISIESGSHELSRWNALDKKWYLNDKEEPGIIYGFIRLRLNQDNNGNHYGMMNPYFPSIQDAAFIRELHVYGQVATNKLRVHSKSKTQHHGIGKTLLEMAEVIARQNKYKKIAIISGEGVIPYYQSRGYNKLDTFMVKDLKINWLDYIFCHIVPIIIFIVIFLTILIM
jgi:ELP3 family radical SAM enzyme/protein acetyltransferase